MTDIKHPRNKEASIVSECEPETDAPFYVEKDTRFIYEVQFFNDFVLVRPASPAFASALRQLSLGQFNDEFEEFWGDPQQVRDILSGEGSALESFR